MICVSCKVAVPPTFIKAIADNTCPACGKEIMPARIYKEFGQIKEMLATAEIDDGTLIKMSALIVEKYTLVPRVSIVGGAQQPGARIRPKPITRKDEVDEEIAEEEELDLSVLSPEDAAAEIARRASKATEDEEIARQWGLEDGQYATAALSKKTSNRQVAELPDLFGDQAPIPFEEPTEGGMGQDLFTKTRMARLAALKSESSYGIVNRMGD